jgi:hypothetical protein
VRRHLDPVEGPEKKSSKTQFLFLLVFALALAATVDHVFAAWIGMPRIGATYRRIGPQSGPQIFCAGSSLLQFAVSWAAVSETLGQGIETWGVAGSSPVEWEVSQAMATNYNKMIIGVSVYDLNEHSLSDSRANIVPLTQTIADLWHSRSNWEFSKRSLGQYPLASLRLLFPTAGRSDATLVGVRRKLKLLMHSTSGEDDRAVGAVLLKQGVLQFDDDPTRVSDWPVARGLRRVALMRTAIQGKHAFNGPKSLALHRMIRRALVRGDVIIVVVPVAAAYAREFLTPTIVRHFEDALASTQRAGVHFVRLDRLSSLQYSNDYFSDLVHLNSDGRRLATEAFVAELNRIVARQ